jgi:hypothetical protein
LKVRVPRWGPPLLAFALHLPHRLGDNDGEVLRKVLYGPIQKIDLPVKAVDFFLDPIEARLDGCEIIAVAARLFEDMSRHQLLALDLAFEHAASNSSLVACVRNETIHPQVATGYSTIECDINPPESRFRTHHSQWRFGMTEPQVLRTVLVMAFEN